MEMNGKNIKLKHLFEEKLFLMIMENLKWEILNFDPKIRVGRGLLLR